MQIYFMQAGCGGPVKIGITDNLDARVNQIQNGNPEEVEVVAVYEVGGRADAMESENMLHEYFKWHRIRGEWFRPSCYLYDWIGTANKYGIEKSTTAYSIGETADRLYSEIGSDSISDIEEGVLRLLRYGDTGPVTFFLHMMESLIEDLKAERENMNKKDCAGCSNNG